MNGVGTLNLTDGRHGMVNVRMLLTVVGEGLQLFSGQEYSLSAKLAMQLIESHHAVPLRPQPQRAVMSAHEVR